MLDWITRLPESRRKNTGELFNTILTIVYRITKAARFISTYSDTTTDDFARFFFKNIEYKYRIPTTVISNRDSRITS